MLIINDVAVLRVKGPIKFNQKVQTVQLASGSRNYEGSNCVLSGWGTTVVSNSDAEPLSLNAKFMQKETQCWCSLQVGGNTPNKLQYINLVIESQAKCKQAHWQVRDSHICTFTKRGEGACHVSLISYIINAIVLQLCKVLKK